MKPASAALIALLTSARQFHMADLFSFTLAGGGTFRFSGMDVDLAVGASLYAAGGLKFQRGATRLTRGLEVDTLEVTVFADASALFNGTPFLPFVRSGGLDGAGLVLERAFMPMLHDTAAGAVTLFDGRIADIELGRSQARLTVKSWLELLNLKLPRNVYQPGCLHTLFDSGCGLSKAAFAVAGSVAGGSDRSSINTDLAAADGTFDLGTIEFAGGANAGQKRTIKSQAGGTVRLSYPLPLAPAAGDGFTAYPGCDKTSATCAVKFANLANFRGFPYIPVPETAR